MNRFTNNLYDSEIGPNIEESTLGLAQYGGCNIFNSASSSLSSIEEGADDIKNKTIKNVVDTGKNIAENVADTGKNIIDNVAETGKNIINGLLYGKNKDGLESIDPLMSVVKPQQNNSLPITNSQRLENNNNNNKIDSSTLGLSKNEGEAETSATVSLYQNLNKIVNGGCNCQKQYCGGNDEEDNKLISSEEIINKINDITGEGGNCQKGGDDDFIIDGGDLDDDFIDELDEENNEVSDDEEEDLFNGSDSESDNLGDEEQYGGSKKKFNPGFSNFINGLYGECMKGGRRRKRFNPEAIEWNKKTNEFIQNNFNITDWDKIKIIKFIANSKNRKSIGEDKLKSLSDVERAKLLFDAVSSMKPADIKKIDFKKMQEQRIKLIKEKYGDKYHEPKPKQEVKPKEEAKPKEEKKETKKESKKESKKETKKSKKGGYDDLFLGGDSESIQLPGNIEF